MINEGSKHQNGTVEEKTTNIDKVALSFHITSQSCETSLGTGTCTDKTTSAISIKQPSLTDISLNELNHAHTIKKKISIKKMNQDIDNISTESQKNCNQSDVSSTHPSVPLAIPGTESSQQSEQMSPLMQPLPINSQQALLPMASNKNQILVIRLIMHGKVSLQFQCYVFNCFSVQNG